MSVVWNPEKELKDEKVILSPELDDGFVESGEGIERQLVGEGKLSVSKWNPEKELKDSLGASLRNALSEWNPEKELKVLLKCYEPHINAGGIRRRN